MNIDPPLPHSKDAERAVLGGILLDNEYLSVARAVLQPSDFFLTPHSRIFQRMMLMADSGLPIDLVTLEEELKRTGELEKAGGAGFVAQLVDGVPRVANVAHHAQIVKDRALLRNLAHLAESILKRATETGAVPNGLLAFAKKSLATLRSQDGFHRSSRIRNWDEVPSLAELPNDPVEYLVDPLIPLGSMTDFFGEASHYKTWPALDIGKAVQKGSPFAGNPTIAREVLYLDFENPASVILDRCQHLGINGIPMKYWGMFSPEDPPKVGDARLLAFARERKPLIIVDSLVRFHNADENKAAEMSRVMRFLRQLVSAGATVLLLHHRGKNEGPYRGSSDILAGADVAYKIKRQGRNSPVVELDCIKNRFAPERTFAFQLERGGFVPHETEGDSKQKQEAQEIASIIAERPKIN